MATAPLRLQASPQDCARLQGCRAAGLQGWRTIAAAYKAMITLLGTLSLLFDRKLGLKAEQSLGFVCRDEEGGVAEGKEPLRDFKILWIVVLNRNRRARSGPTELHQRIVRDQFGGGTVEDFSH